MRSSHFRIGAGGIGLLVAGILGAGVLLPLAYAGGPVKRVTRMDATDVDPKIIVERRHVSTSELNLLGKQPAAAEAPKGLTDQTAASTPVAATPEPTANDKTAPIASPSKDYRIGPGDFLSFQSFDDPTLTRDQVLVLYDGSVSLPMISDVNLDGLTRDEAEAAIRNAYKKVFKDPQISISVRGSGSKFFYVLGQVTKPAKYPFENPINVLEAINIAGGSRIDNQGRSDRSISAQGTLSKAFIIRPKKEGRDVIELDLSGLTQKGPHPSETPVEPGDIVYLPEGVNLVYVLGEVRDPSVFQLAEGQTLTQVLAVAGGPNETNAKLRSVVILRPIDPTTNDVMLVDWRSVLKTGKDIMMKPGDIVYIPRKRLVRLDEFIQRATGTVTPLLSLYTQAYDAYFTDRRYNLLFKQNGSTNQLVSTLQAVSNFGSLLGNIPTLPTIP